MKNVSEIMFGWCLNFDAVYISRSCGLVKISFETCFMNMFKTDDGPPYNENII